MFTRNPLRWCFMMILFLFLSLLLGCAPRRQKHTKTLARGVRYTCQLLWHNGSSSARERCLRKSFLENSCLYYAATKAMWDLLEGSFRHFIERRNFPLRIKTLLWTWSAPHKRWNDKKHWISINKTHMFRCCWARISAIIYTGIVFFMPRFCSLFSAEKELCAALGTAIFSR